MNKILNKFKLQGFMQMFAGKSANKKMNSQQNFAGILKKSAATNKRSSVKNTVVNGPQHKNIFAQPVINATRRVKNPLSIQQQSTDTQGMILGPDSVSGQSKVTEPATGANSKSTVNSTDHVDARGNRKNIDFQQADKTPGKKTKNTDTDLAGQVALALANPVIEPTANSKNTILSTHKVESGVVTDEQLVSESAQPQTDDDAQQTIHVTKRSGQSRTVTPGNSNKENVPHNTNVASPNKTVNNTKAPVHTNIVPDKVATSTNTMSETVAKAGSTTEKSEKTVTAKFNNNGKTSHAVNVEPSGSKPLHSIQEQAIDGKNEQSEKPKSHATLSNTVNTHTDNTHFVNTHVTITHNVQDKSNENVSNKNGKISTVPKTAQPSATGSSSVATPARSSDQANVAEPTLATNTRQNNNSPMESSTEKQYYKNTTQVKSLLDADNSQIQETKAGKAPISFTIEENSFHSKPAVKTETVVRPEKNINKTVNTAKPTIQNATLGVNKANAAAVQPGNSVSDEHTDITEKPVTGKQPDVKSHVAEAKLASQSNALYKEANQSQAQPKVYPAQAEQDNLQKNVAQPSQAEHANVQKNEAQLSQANHDNVQKNIVQPSQAKHTVAHTQIRQPEPAVISSSREKSVSTSRQENNNIHTVKAEPVKTTHTKAAHVSDQQQTAKSAVKPPEVQKPLNPQTSNQQTKTGNRVIPDINGNKTQVAAIKPSTISSTSAHTHVEHPEKPTPASNQDVKSATKQPEMSVRQETVTNHIEKIVSDVSTPKNGKYNPQQVLGSKPVKSSSVQNAVNVKPSPEQVQPQTTANQSFTGTETDLKSQSNTTSNIASETNSGNAYQQEISKISAIRELSFQKAQPVQPVATKDAPVADTTQDATVPESESKDIFSKIRQIFTTANTTRNSDKENDENKTNASKDTKEIVAKHQAKAPETEPAKSGKETNAPQVDSELKKKNKPAPKVLTVNNSVLKTEKKVNTGSIQPGTRQDFAPVKANSTISTESKTLSKTNIRLENKGVEAVGENVVKEQSSVLLHEREIDSPDAADKNKVQPVVTRSAKSTMALTDTQHKDSTDNSEIDGETVVPSIKQNKENTAQRNTKSAPETFLHVQPDAGQPVEPVNQPSTTNMVSGQQVDSPLDNTEANPQTARQAQPERIEPVEIKIPVVKTKAQYHNKAKDTENPSKVVPVQNSTVKTRDAQDVRQHNNPVKVQSNVMQNQDNMNNAGGEQQKQEHQQSAQDIFRESQTVTKATGQTTPFVAQVQSDPAAATLPAAEITQMVTRISEQLDKFDQNGMQRLQINARTSELGMVRIELVRQQDEVQVVLKVQSEQSHKMLEQVLPELKQALVKGPVNIQDIRVVYADARNQQQTANQHGFEQNKKSKQQKEQKLEARAAIADNGQNFAETLYNTVA